MLLETKRLELIALTPERLELWTENLPVLEKELNVVYQAEPMTDVFLEIVRGQLAIVKKFPDAYLWRSFWLLVRKSDRIVVGSADFKDVPNDRGEVEIGYGLGRAFEHNGYMTEAVEAMSRWALTQNGVEHIVAETDLDNLPSQNILTRNGFKEFKRGETLWFRL